MTWLYRRLLICYPRPFRARFGEELAAAFDAGLRARRRLGWRPATTFTLTRLADAITSGFGERWATRQGGSPAGRRHVVTSAARPDIRFALRALRRQPRFSLLVIGTLALGIGASTTVFSVVDAVLLRPLPYAHPDRLMLVHTENQPLAITAGPSSYLDFLDWRAAGIFDDAGIYQFGSSIVSIGAGSERVRSVAASASLFSTLGVDPLIGRLPTAEEDRPGSAPVILLTEAIWRRAFGSDPAIVSRAINVDGTARSVVGVLPATFSFDRDPELWTTFEGESGGDLLTRANRYLEVIARIAPGASRDQVNARLQALCERLDQLHGDSNRNWRAGIVPWHETEAAAARPQLILLAGSVGLVLLIACSNVAMLLVAQGLSRTREVAMRAALGAGRFRIVSQLLTESLTLSLAGGLLGLGLAMWWVSLITAFGPADIPRLDDARIDGRVLLFALAASCGATMLFGVLPALQASKPNVNSLLQDATRTSTPGRRRRRMGDALLAAETAISLVLIVGSALMAKSFLTLSRVDAGFRADHLLTWHLPLPTTKFLADGVYQRDRVRQYYEGVVARLEAHPDVASAAATLELPLGGGGYRMWTGFELIGRSGATRESLSISNNVTPHFFAAMEMPLLRGRAFTEHDRFGGPPVAIVSQAFVRKFLAAEDPIGRQIRIGERSGPREIVGVVGDIKSDGLDSEPNPIVYQPFAQDPKPFMAMVARTRTDAAALGASLSRELLKIDPGVPPYRVRSADELRSRTLGARRFGTILMAAFSAVALVLALVGLYAVIARLVAASTREIGVRVALGASGGSVLRTLLRRTLGPSMAGLGVGVLAAIAIAPVLGRLLYGVEPLDPVVLLVAPLALAAACVLASVVPARRALRVDPVVALRAE